MATYPGYVWDGSAWQPIGSQVADMSPYALANGTNAGAYYYTQANGPSGFRNVLINGDMRVAQRGSTGASATNNATGWSADRWQVYRASYTANCTWAAAQSGFTGFPHLLRVQRTAGDTSSAHINIVQPLETVNSLPLAGKTVTLSFSIRKGASFQGTMTAAVTTGTGTDQRFPSGWTGAFVAMTTDVVPTASEQRFSVTGTLPSNATQVAVHFQWIPSGTAAANEYIELSGVQLELGSVATPFEFRPYGTELAMCQRYYWRNIAGEPYGMLLPLGVANSPTVVKIPFFFPVPLRGNPSQPEVSGSMVVTDGANSVPLSTLTTADFNKNGMTVQAAVNSGLTQYRPYFVMANNNSAAYIAFGAEL